MIYFLNAKKTINNGTVTNVDAAICRLEKTRSSKTNDVSLNAFEINKYFSPSTPPIPVIILGQIYAFQEENTFKMLCYGNKAMMTSKIDRNGRRFWYDPRWDEINENI